MAVHPRLERDAAQSKLQRNATRRTLRILLTLLIALAATYWAGRAMGLSNDELLGYLLASVGLVAAAAVVALILFGLVRLVGR